jgi:hypothetical protein
MLPQFVTKDGRRVTYQTGVSSVSVTLDVAAV